MLGVHRQILGRTFQFIGIRTTVTEVVVATAEVPRLALPPRQVPPTRSARPVRTATVGDVGEFVHQRAAARTAGAGHAFFNDSNPPMYRSDAARASWREALDFLAERPGAL